MIRRPLEGARRVVGFMGGAEGGLVKRVVRSGMWVGVQNAGANILQTVRSIILARLLTPEIFGLMSLCQVAVRGLDLFTETGIAPALIHRQERVAEAVNTAYTLQIMRGFLLALLAIPLAPLAAAYYGDERLRAVIAVLSMSFIVSGFSNINTILLQKKLDFRRLAALELTLALISTVAVSVLAYIMRSVWALVIGQLLTSAMRVTLSYIIVPGRPVMRFDRTIAWELFKYGRFITGLTIVLFVTSEIDNLVVGKVLGLQAARALLDGVHAGQPAGDAHREDRVQRDLPRLQLAAGRREPDAAGVRDRAAAGRRHVVPGRGRHRRPGPRHPAHRLRPALGRREPMRCASSRCSARRDPSACSAATCTTPSASRTSRST